MASNRRWMLTALSMSFLKPSSSVLIDQETVTFPISFSKSMSRTTKSDLVQIRISAPLPFSCSNSLRVLPNCSS